MMTWIIRLANYGCTNRTFHRIVLLKRWEPPSAKPHELLGCFDPLPNEHGEKLISINLERVSYWLGQGALTSRTVGELLGFMGYLPVHPYSYFRAKQRRRDEAIASGEMELPEKILSREGHRTVTNLPRLYEELEDGDEDALDVNATMATGPNKKVKADNENVEES